MKVLLMMVPVIMMMSSCGYTLKPNRGDIAGTVGTTAPSSEPAISASTTKEATASDEVTASEPIQSIEMVSVPEEGQSAEAVVVPVSEAVRKKVVALIGVVYPKSPDLIVDVEGAILVEGTPAYCVYVGSPNEMTTTTMELFAVNIETNDVYLMDRVSGQYGLIASVPHMDVIDKARCSGPWFRDIFGQAFYGRQTAVSWRSIMRPEPKAA